ncbi:MAG TPA: enoyl-CoA hydratase/isomerase family protein [Thermoanaerobaculia bacterium]|nr:enoyl-CoA hydratase/isomerase family protein [Thermoanaerobaculia bacterium]
MKIQFAADANAYRITLNALPLHILDIAMLEELRDAIARVANDRHALIIDATGDNTFSAGANVHDHIADRVATMLHVFHDCFRALARLELVTIALVRGTALGGGCELALACDFALASDRARFGLPEISLGVFPPVAAGLLPRDRRSLELMLTGDPIDAAAAQQLGIVNAVFPHDQFETRATEWLQRLYRQSASSLRFAKKAYGLGDLAAVEQLYLDELMKTNDANEGIAAFIEKRKPRW